jgi:two-component system nitrogen regulation response regulator GlnG
MTAPPKPRVLVIDDGLTYARVVAEQMPEFQLVKPNGDDGDLRIPDGPAAIAFLETRAAEVDIVLLDMQFDVPPERLLPLGEGTSPRRLRRFQGVAILREIRKRFPELPVVLLTDAPDLSLVDAAGELAAQSMTYFMDGEDLDALRIRIHGALEQSALALEEAQIFWGRDAAMRALRRRLAVLARGRLPVILEGETGTGKSYLAERFLHANSGRPGPFVTLDLATVPSDLIAAHLFGAVRGAYTGSIADRKGVFELAHKGTLFIDEIQNVPLEVQKQLLLVLQDGRLRPVGSSREIAVDVKVIAASNTSLTDAVAAGRFRPDLYMRLSPATRVIVPPLRDRPKDLPFLAQRFLDRASTEPEIAELCALVARALGLSEKVAVTLVLGRRRSSATAGSLELVMPEPAWNLLSSHRWPGNMRELSMMMHNLLTFTLVGAVDAIRAGVRLTSPRLQVDPGLVGNLLQGSAVLGGGAGSTSVVPAGSSANGDGLRVRLEQAPTLNAVATAVERQYFLHLFRETNGDFGRMAEQLLGDAAKSRAVRLRFNQLGLKVREILGR